MFTRKISVLVTIVCTATIVIVLQSQLLAKVKLDLSSKKIFSSESSDEIRNILTSDKLQVTSIKSVQHPLSYYGDDLCLLYGKQNTTTTRKYQHPNIVHYVKIAGDEETDTELKLLDYVSILSVDKNYKPDKIVIHSNKNVTGELWKLTNTLNTTIEEQYVERSATIGKFHYKKPIAITHEADVHKLNIAL